MTALERLGGRVFDLAAIGASVFGALVITSEAESSGRIAGDATFFSLLLALAGSIALWWRRRHPVGVTVLLVVIAAVTDFASFAGLIALCTVIARRRGRTPWVLTGLYLLAGTVYSVWRPDPTLPPPIEFVLSVAFLIATVAIAVAMRSRRDLVDSLRERAVRAEQEAHDRADRLRGLERERIAREMHDALAHRISLVSLHAGALQINPDLTPEQVANAAATIRDSAHQALEDLREILGVLRAGTVDPGGELRPQPGLTLLGELIGDARAAGVRVDFADRSGDAPTGAALGRTVYRLVQEGLTNAGKHASGTTVNVELSRLTPSELHVLVTNPIPARPGPAPPGAGAGLVGLAERVGLLGGRLRHGVHRAPDGSLSFRLEAWLPWPV
ncbi:sensor histidine kinase [Actinoplanes awajinensis]|uniref:histidine kinase n=1 Tax=Actinoplanes awajinensis subsp. mycoplanecinus TaxID=135947 RepID=A0A101JNC0_9ACTN|nr:histidine kinase [Actinoplanes awajinensis]KUL30059.1 histidine kinase [Actinoplanes awajinensis subsp. mycoplanecinus]